MVSAVVDRQKMAVAENGRQKKRAIATKNGDSMEAHRYSAHSTG
jgi:hypothetical protein